MNPSIPSDVTGYRKRKKQWQTPLVANTSGLGQKNSAKTRAGETKAVLVGVSAAVGSSDFFAIGAPVSTGSRNGGEVVSDTIDRERARARIGARKQAA